MKANCGSAIAKASFQKLHEGPLAALVVMSSVSSRVELHSGIPVFLSQHNNNDGHNNLFSDRRDPRTRHQAHTEIIETGDNQYSSVRQSGEDILEAREENRRMKVCIVS